MMRQINRPIESQYRILIHDTIGKERLGFVITAFFMQYYHLTRDQALNTVRQLKPDIKPPAVYMRLLLQYEDYLFPPL